MLRVYDIAAITTRGTPRKPDSIGSEFRLDPDANSPESQTHLRLGGALPFFGGCHTPPHSGRPPCTGMGRFFNQTAR